MITITVNSQKQSKPKKKQNSFFQMEKGEGSL